MNNITHTDSATVGPNTIAMHTIISWALIWLPCCIGQNEAVMADTWLSAKALVHH